MTKTQARRLFRGNYKNLCANLGYSPGWVSAWPEQLDEQRINEIVGCALRKKLIKNLEDLNDFLALDA